MQSLYTLQIRNPLTKVIMNEKANTSLANWTPSWTIYIYIYSDPPQIEASCLDQPTIIYSS